VITVVPVTSDTTWVFPFQAPLSTGSGLAVDSKARAEQITSIAVQRLLKQLGRCSPADLAALDDALRLDLYL
jgi:mRNA interferase MazF